MICFSTLSLEKGINEKEFVEDIVGRRAVLHVMRFGQAIYHTLSRIYTNTHTYTHPHTTNRLKYAKLVTCQYNKMSSIYLLVFVRWDLAQAQGDIIAALSAHNIYVNET